MNQEPNAFSWPLLLEKLLQKQDLMETELQAVLAAILAGEAEAVPVAAFLTALRAKGESVAEITAAVAMLRQWMTQPPLAAHCTPLLDTCGTGGDGAGIFNVSTAVSFVAAAAGAYVVKHGNRAQSGKSGSADVLAHLGVRLELTPQQAADCLAACHMVFLYAPQYHPALRHVAPVRKALKIRTLFNLLGPLANPMLPPFQVIGVFAEAWLQPLAEVLKNLGSQRVLLVHSEDGLDEISSAAPTQVVELNQGEITSYQISPADFQLPVTPLAALQIDSVAASAQLLTETLAGRGVGQTIVALNAGAAIYAAGLAPTLAAGVAKASQLLAEQAGLTVLEQLKVFTQSQENQ
jgi:anthranilate phosphoribosyltransferase